MIRDPVVFQPVILRPLFRDFRTCEAQLEWSGLEDFQSGLIFLVGLFVPELLNKTSLLDSRPRCISTCDLAAVILRFQRHVGNHWNGLVLKILKVVSYFLLALFVPELLNKTSLLDSRPHCILTCDLAAGIKVSVLLCNSQGKVSILLCNSQGKVSILHCNTQGNVSILFCNSQGKVSILLCNSQGKVSILLCNSWGKVSILLCNSRGKVSICSEALSIRHLSLLTYEDMAGKMS